jgi:PIN domain nuclease of toxin-antitoxin system
VRILLDTCTFLWWMLGAPELSDTARELVVEPANEVYLSAVSSWEIAIKYRAGRLWLPEPPGRYVPSRRRVYGIKDLPLEEEAALHVVRLPRLHGDPFDRMLVCQSIIHGLTILTPDELIAQYPVRVAW